MADFSSVPGAYIGRDGNWYGPDGSLLGPSDQAPNPAVASGTGPGAPPGPPAVQQNLTGAPAATSASPTDWQGLQTQVFGSQPSVAGATPPPFSYAQFQAPAAWQAPAPFSAPSGQDVLNADPGYQFRLDQGTGALQNSAAAQGVLNTGGTLQDLINYGQNAASQEYGNAYNRDLGTYQTNYNNGLNAYQANYQDQLNNYLTNYGNALTQYNTNYQTQYAVPFSQLMQQYGNNVSGQNQIFGQQFATATA